MAGGRPTKYKKKYCEMLFKHMSDGYSYETFSAVLGVCRQTMYDWEKKHPEFLDTKKRAFDACQLTWEKIGVAQSVGNTKHGKGAPASWIFNMKNRFGWKSQDNKIDITVRGFADALAELDVPDDE